MRIRPIQIALPIVALTGALWIFASGGEDPVDFNRDIRPILNEKCVTCHGGVRRKADLSLLFRQDALEPAESGKRAIVPGNPGRSELIHRVRNNDPDERMPLDAAPLTDEEIALLKTWIEQGAEWAPHWAYVAPVMPDLPSVSDADRPRNGIDHFVLARLDVEELEPSPEAGCTELIRRVSLDLVGLPPTPEEADAFCADRSDEAYARVVDSLLASPRFGERWAALWLDLARYADSNGYEKDEPRVIWKYRDWVIRAFNADMPFDRFTIAQLAGDMLPDAGEEEPVATAFHRNTMTNTEGGTDNEEFRTAAVIDRINTTFEVWQGTTIGCVQCHGHPYDPFRHEEFYKLYAFFNNTEDADRDDNEPKVYHFPEEAATRGRELAAQLEDVEPEIDSAVYAAWLTRLEAYAADDTRPPTFDERLVPIDLLRMARKTSRDPYEERRLREFYVAIRPEFEPLRTRRAALMKEIRELEPVTTPVLRELPAGEKRWTHVFDRGNWLVHGERVEPEVPRSLPAMSDDMPRNRLGLARWLVSDENPFTSRVMVNRFWEQLFGVGIVETVEDFGTQGSPPTHPELLDWLAMRFMGEHGWSVKSLLREIVTSATYRQSSRISPEMLERDPQNQLLTRGPRFRLSAEQLRDQALAVSGLLSDKMYGPSVYPPQPPDIWRNPYSSLRWETSEGEDRYRRAVYTYWRRTVPYPAMMTFDATSREICLSRRIRTNTPLQALVTLNDEAFVEAAAALARRMDVEGGPSLEGKFRRGYRLALLREPSREVLESLVDLYYGAVEEYRQADNVVREVPVQTTSDGPPRAAVRSRGVTRSARDSSPAALGALPDDAELAALTVVANAVMNLDAFLTKQ